MQRSFWPGRTAVAMFGAAMALSAAGHALAQSTDALKVTAQFAKAANGKPARLYVTAQVERGWHIYSMTQPKGGPLPSKIKLTPSDQYKLAGDFKASPKAELHNEPEVWPDVEIETHEGKVTWYVPIEFAPGADPATVAIEGKLNVQACNSRGCLPPKDYKFTAALGEPVEIKDETAAK